MTPPTKVLLLVENNGFPRDFRVRREAHALRDAGYEVSVICPREHEEPWRERRDGVEIFRFPAPPGGSGVLSYAFEFGYATLAMLLLSLWVALRRGVDVVHAANPPDTLCLIGLVFRLLGKRFIFDHHDLAPEIYLSRSSRAQRNAVHACLCAVERWSLRIANVVISTNETYRQHAIDVGRKAPEQVFVVRNGPPLSYQPLDPPPEIAGRAPHVIGYIGTIGPQDGVDYLVRAVHALVYRLMRTDFVVVVIGDGDALPAVKALAAELNVGAFMLFVGRQSELESRRILSAAHVCVQPDPLNPLNDKCTMNKLMEYMALGKPTVAFDLKETRFSAQSSAVYVVPNDVEMFAKKIAWLLDKPDIRAQMGRIGQERIRTALAWEFSVRDLLRAYDAALGVRARELPGAAPVAEKLQGDAE